MDGDGDRAARNSNDNTRLIFPLVAEPSPRRGRFDMAIAGVVIGVVLLGAVVAALTQLDQNPATGGATAAASDADRTASPVNDGRTGRLSVFELEPGMCLGELAGDTDLQYVPIVSCEEEHVAEIAATLRMSEGSWPGPAAVEEFAGEHCVAAIHRAGIDASLDLRWTYLGPTGSSWNTHHDRTISCVVAGDGRPLTEPVIGTPTSRSSSEQRVVSMERR